MAWLDKLSTPHPTHNPLTFILSPPRGRGQGEGGEEKR